MSDKRGLLAGVIGLGTALVSLGRDVIAIWRERPEPRKADRTAADELARRIREDGGR